jgi:hypothetical protein
MNNNIDDTMGLTYESHMNILKQNIIIIGGVTMMIIYRHIKRHFGYTYITDFESLLVLFIGSYIIIYTAESAMNSKVVTANLFST